MAGLATVAGLMLTARTGAAIPSMAGHLGQDWLLPALLAPVRGGTLTGVVIIAIITQGLVLFGVDRFAMQIALGGLILWAVAIDRTRTKIAGGNAMPEAFAALNITRAFPGVRALSDVSIRLQPGSIHALPGENGAGKSTLIKVITGVHQADSGQLLVAGQPVHLRDIPAANANGNAVVHQERHLIPRFSIGENIMPDRLGKGPLSTLDDANVHAGAAKWLAALKPDLDPRIIVERLSVARMQLVEIAKALSWQARVLLLDEPTASLTGHETDALFTQLRKVRHAGVAIVFVSHKLEEVLALCDRVTVLRDGRNACDSQPLTGMTRNHLVQPMIGRGEQIANWQARDRATGVPVLGGCRGWPAKWATGR